MKYLLSRSKLLFLLVLLFTSTLLLSCGSSDEEVLVGTWRIDQDAMNKMAEEKISGSSNPMEIGQARMAKAMVAEMRWTISLDKDGSASFSMDEGDYLQDATGKWIFTDGVITLTYHNKRDQSTTLTGTVKNSRIYLDSQNQGQPGMILKNVGPPLVVVAKVAPTVPPLGPLRQDCSPSLASVPRSESSAIDDILGLHPGLSFNDVVALLECRDDIRLVQTSALWSAQDNYGIPTRQLVRASDGIPCSPQEAARVGACDTGGDRFEPLRDISREFIIAFTGLPEHEIARAIWRRDIYTSDNEQSISALTQALTQKYGPPQLQAVGNSSRITHIRPNATNMIWLSSRDGLPIPLPASEFNNAAMNWETCANGMQPRFVERHGWNSACNLTIRAEILPRAENNLLAQELNMVVVNQRDLYHGNTQFKSALRIVAEEKLRNDNSTAPEM